MKKPIGIYIFGTIYLILGVVVIIGYIYLLATDWAILTIESYNAGDVVYTAEAAEWIAKYALVPAIFIGGVFAIPGSLLVLKEDHNYKKQGYYLMLLSSVMWTLLILGLITIFHFLREDIKEYLLV
ncbi:MAG: hypothetical protein ACTSR8_07505 [Promethearchaeota archaeon]